MKLDVSRLSRQALYGPEGNQVDLAKDVILGTRGAVYELGRHGLIKPVKSYGFAAAYPLGSELPYWDNPYEFVWFVAGWGPDANRYIANAVRKLRATLRRGKSTLELREEGGQDFRDVVASVEDDGSFEWGDFPWGGGVLARTGNIVVPSAVSALLEIEDHAAAMLDGCLVGTEMLRLDKPEKYGPNL